MDEKIIVPGGAKPQEASDGWVACGIPDHNMPGSSKRCSGCGRQLDDLPPSAWKCPDCGAFVW